MNRAGAASDRDRGGVRARVSAWLSSLGTVLLVAGAAYYFLAAVNWLFNRSWPDWSLRRLGLGRETAGEAFVPRWLVELLFGASPGFLALLAAAVVGSIAVLFDPHAVRRGPVKR